MKESPDPLLLRDAIKSLGNALRAEQKVAFANTSQPSGLDAFIDDWLCDYPGVSQYGPLTVVVTALRGYDSFAVHKRELRGEAGLKALLALYNSTIKPTDTDSPPAPPVSAPSRIPTQQTASPPAPSRTDASPKSATPKAKKPATAPASTTTGTKPVSLTSALDVVPGVGISNAKAFRRLGVRTVRDVLYHFPFRYEDRSNRQTIADMRPGETYSVVGTVVDSRTFTMRAGGSGLEFKIEDDTGILKLSFFRQPWLAKQLKIGASIMVSGKVEHFNGMRQMTGPDWQFYHGDHAEDLLHVGRLVPIHPLTEGLVEKGGREIIKKLVDGYAGQLADPLPAAVLRRAQLLDLPTAIRHKHFPPNEDAILRADQRLGFDEFLCIQLGVLQRKMVSQNELSLPIPYDDAVHQAFLAKLPFALTNAQTRALGEIFADIATPVPMARLLQGDVGSGKTAVAAAAALQAIAGGFQAAIMAPTEILAEQHYRGLTALLGDLDIPRSTVKEQGLIDPERASRINEIQLLLGMDPARVNGVRVALLTGSLGVRDRRRVLEGVSNGEIDLVIGTHALITESVQYHRLGLAIVDEQHRFGVEQRQALKNKGTSPHLLVMTATPIPRTLTMTIYGDLDTSVLDELPPGRQAIATKRIRAHERERAYKHIRKEVANGRQIFVICPLVEESETLDVASAEEMYVKLQSEVFPDLRVTLIHGKMSARDKDTVMVSFRNHEYDILVATAVIEVGIDIPNATTMLIEGADRFGLAQLHQFRGRVGRGAHKSYCILVSDRDAEPTERRLTAMEETRDGFRLAEIDLELRGPGEFFGTRQSGIPDLKIAKLTDTELLLKAQAEAKLILRADPELAAIEHALLRTQVEAFWARAVEAN
ncbi:MAG: hypothetical protein RLY87_2800 [Chloroflexota bacterium]|jgi:ATP-dependent DNA helicase RecG